MAAHLKWDLIPSLLQLLAATVFLSHPPCLALISKEPDIIINGTHYGTKKESDEESTWP